MLLVLSLVVVFSASSASAESSLVHEVCSKTDDYPGCVAALHLDPRAANATTLRSLGEIALQTASKNTAMSENHVDRMLADPNTRSSWKPVLQTCKANFELAAGELLVASRELVIDRISANYDVWMASQEIDACLAFMRSCKQKIPPLVARCAHARTHVSIGLVITELL